ncbi:MAG: hypothetical protein GX993_06810 [Bacteroidales bacterium]|nr:hypothetical protein [Bacteroidales bacterium]
MEKTRKDKKWLALAIVLILLGSILAYGINTSLGNVNVSQIEFKTERGTMAAYLYMPEGAGENDPRPVIVLTHGYLNSKEMQDAAAVEMSRRGYIVLCVDQYDHGLSRWEADIPLGTEMGTFFIWSMFDAVTYAYNQPYTLKDENGNGYIGCSGHSMGGLSTVLAIYFDEMQSLQTGYRMIYAAIPQSADFSFTDNVAPTEAILAAYGNRTIGVISGHYDEFFFGTREGMYYKDWINESITGPMFLGLKDGEVGKSGQFYDVESGPIIMDGNVVRESQTGKHIVYLVDETHAKNHFSVKVQKHIIDFFQTAFRGVTPKTMTLANMTSSNQVWWLKEAGNFIALIGFFMFFVPFISLITKFGFFKKAVTEETAPVPAPATRAGRIVFWVATIIFAVLPAILYIPVTMKIPTSLRIIEIVAIIFAAVMLVIGILARAKASKDTSGKYSSYARGAFISTVISVILVVVLIAYKLFDLNPWFNQTTTNWTAYWALILGLIFAVVAVITYYFANKPNGVSIDAYGIRIKLSHVISAFVTAFVAFAVGYLLLFIIQGIFNVDFRIWTWAVKVFKVEHFLTMLKYLPLYFIFYLSLTVLLNVNSRALKHGYLYSIISTCAGLVLWMAIQYGALYVRGLAAWPTQGMISIGLLATIPNLIVATIFTKKIYDITNNVWTASFFNALLFTMIPVANTLLYWNLV